MYMLRTNLILHKMEGCDLATKRTSIEDYRSCDLHVLPLSFMSLQKKGWYLTSLFFLCRVKVMEEILKWLGRTADASCRKNSVSHAHPEQVPQFFTVC